MELIKVDSKKYRDRFVARLVKKGYEKSAALETAAAWEEVTSSLASPEADPEYEADDCFTYWRNNEPTF